MKKYLVIVMIFMAILSGCSQARMPAADSESAEITQTTGIPENPTVLQGTDTTYDVSNELSVTFADELFADQFKRGYLYFENDTTNAFADLYLKIETSDQTLSANLCYGEKKFFPSGDIIIRDFNQDGCPDFFVWCMVSTNGGAVCQIYSLQSGYLNLLCDLNKMDSGITVSPQDNYRILVEDAAKTSCFQVDLASRIDPTLNPDLYDNNGKLQKDFVLSFRSIDEYTVDQTDLGVPCIVCTRVMQYNFRITITYTVVYSPETHTFTVNHIKSDDRIF